MHAFLTGGSGAPPSSPRAKAKKAGEQQQRQRRLPWVEKYRPQKVAEIAAQTEVVAVLQRCLDSAAADVPHFLFYGPPGTGKTSAILAVCRQMFGAHYRQRVLELNASDERGIQVVRERVKGFARQAVGGGIPLKVIVLDEADCMTPAAQAALRRTMERESRTTRFCLVCNFVSRIIEPLASRCAKFRFKPLDADTQRASVKRICDAESVKYEECALDALLSVSEGDLRRAITLLQSAAACVAPAAGAAAHKRPKKHAGDKERAADGADSADSGAGVVTERLVRELAAVVPDEVIDKLIVACKSNSFDAVHTNVMDIESLGYPSYQLMLQLTDRIVCDAELTEMAKAIICDHIAMCESRLIDGADEYLQNLDLACTMMAQYQCVHK